MTLRQNYNFENESNYLIKDLIIDTENEIKHLEAKISQCYITYASKQNKKIQWC
jgi:hypothetical protein